MEQKKKSEPKSDVKFELYRMFVPRDLLAFFDIVEVNELTQEWHIILREKEELIPVALQGETDVALDGFCNPFRILSHAFSLKPIYLVITQRQWKKADSDKHYSNTYEITKDSSNLPDDVAGFVRT